MAIIHGSLEKEIIVEDENHMTGGFVAAITVRKGASLQFHGTLVGNIYLDSGSEVFIHGQVTGDVVNQGGQLYIFGMVDGAVIRNGGVTQIDSRAIVSGASPGLKS